MYSSYTAASVAREFELADKHGVNFEGALTWAFEFENQPYFAGFRVLASNGIDLPVLNVFRTLGKMSGERLKVVSSGDPGAESIRSQGVRGTPDVSALASLEQCKLCVLLWHYHDDDLPGPDASIELTLLALPVIEKTVFWYQYRIDAEHSNAFETWKRMGSPQQPTPQQYAQLETSGQLSELPGQSVRVENHTAKLSLKLPRQAVSLLMFEW